MDKKIVGLMKPDKIWRSMVSSIFIEFLDRESSLRDVTAMFRLRIRGDIWGTAANKEKSSIGFHPLPHLSTTPNCREAIYPNFFGIIFTILDSSWSVLTVKCW
jgi:hypothetical protein